MPPRKCGHFVAIAAKRHRAPATAMCARIVVEKEAARGIRAKAHASSLALCDEFRRRMGDRRKKPIQTVYSGDVFDPPGARRLDKLVVAFGDAEDLVDGFNRFARDA